MVYGPTSARRGSEPSAPVPSNLGITCSPIELECQRVSSQLCPRLIVDLLSAFSEFLGHLAGYRPSLKARALDDRSLVQSASLERL